MDRLMNPINRTTPLDGGLDDLRRPILAGLCLAALVISWTWVVIVATAQEQAVAIHMAAQPVILMLLATLVLILSEAQVKIRSILLLIGLMVAVMPWQKDLSATYQLYYQSLVVTIGGLLAGPAVSFLSAAVLTGGDAIAIWKGVISLSSPDIFPALGLLWLTATAAWLSSRNLYTALRWAVDSQARAWQTANEVTRRREQLRRTLDSLRNAHAVLERTSRELEAAQQEAEEARQIKSRFVANISHELRTPLNIIVGFAEMLCTSPETYGDFYWPPALREDLLTIWRNAKHLLDMVDDVLDLAQIEASRLPITPEPTNLSKLIRDALVAASSMLKQSGVELRVSLPSKMPTLNLDATRIREVVLNLLTNAVRFTNNGYIEVSAVTNQREVIVQVRDTGEGIPEDKLETIFQEFEQVDNSIRRRHQGTGLGLALSRHFIRLHGGRMWAESILGHGSSFFFSLPISTSDFAVQPVHPRRPMERTLSDGQADSCLLVLCDDPHVGRMMERHVEGMKVTVVSDVIEATKAVQSQHPSAVMVSTYSPLGKEPTLAQARTLLNDIMPFDVPVIVCGVPTERRASLALGINEVLIKPVIKDQLLQAVERSRPHPKHVLVVDNDHDMVRLLSAMLKNAYPGIEIFNAFSGEEAYSQLARQPDLVLLDLLLPGMSGVELLDRMRQEEQFNNISVVVITARGPAEDMAVIERGELSLLKNSGFTAGELMHLLQLIPQGIKPCYITTRGEIKGTPTIAPA